MPLIKAVIPVFIFLLFVPLFAIGQSEENEMDPIGVSLGSLIDHHLSKKEYGQALQYSDELLDFSQTKYGKVSLAYLRSLGKKSNIYKRQGNYKKALGYQEQQEKLALELFGAEHKQYLLRLHNLAILYYRTGEYTLAGSHYLKSLQLSENLDGRKSLEHAKKIGDYVSLLTRQGPYEKAMDLQQEALRITEEMAGRESIAYVKSLNKIVGIQMRGGALSEALSGGIEALKITEKILGKDNPTYGIRLDNLAMIYERLGLYEEALPLSLEAVQNSEKHYGKEHPEYGISANNLALIYRRLGQYEQALPFFQEALAITEKRRGKEHSMYGLKLDNLAGLYKDMGEYDLALPLSKAAVENALNKVGKNHRNYTVRANNLANIYLRKKQYEQALQLYLETLPITEALVGQRHPEYGRRLHNIGLAYELKGDLSEAVAYYGRSIKNLLQQFKNYYPNLNEAERIKFVDNTFIMFYKHYDILPKLNSSNSDYFIELFNMRLVTKGLALDRSEETRLRSRSSHDQKLKQQYDDWIGLRRQMANLYLRPGVKESELDSLLAIAKDLERSLSRTTLALSDTREPKTVDIRFQDLQDKLGENEVALEFVRYQKFNEATLTDSSAYLAFLIKKNDPFPQLVPLCEETTLNKFLAARINIQSPGSYITNPDIRQELYQLLWQPLEPYLEGIQRVHLSVSGALHKVSFAALANKTNELLIDQLDIRYYHNLRHLLPSTAPQQREKHIALFGGAVYDLDSLALLDIAKAAYAPSPDQLIAFNRSVASDSTRYGIHFPFLPGTQKEVENIEKLFTKQKWSSALFKGTAAREDHFKSLEANPPSIIHLATHGYFFQPYKGETVHNSIRAKVITAKNPLLRSGLAFAGINHAWKGGRPLKGMDDGILTAFEISNLDLSQTDLVVLSACETGLGDVHNGEGVFGLQSAFKIAGVDKMILSLWKVPDRETSELMQAFYQFYLQGLSIPMAFRQAQRELKKKYPPFYWAGFILVE